MLREASIKRIKELFWEFQNIKSGISYEILDDGMKFSIDGKERTLTGFDALSNNEMKALIYKEFLKEGLSLPWGILTGIKPLKLYAKADDKEAFKEKFFISDEKFELMERTFKNQHLNFEPKYSLYIHIPFCKGICSYCSFYTNDISKKDFDFTKYIDTVIDEMKIESKIRDISEPDSIYIGGGTPSAIDRANTQRLLKYINENYKFKELTFECGRADTMDKDLLDILDKYGVSRICINPQTMNEETLKRVHRNAGFDELYKVYELARGYDFDINMDLIIGLEGEKRDDYINSVKKLIAMRPESITIHNLALKIRAVLAQNDFKLENINLSKEIYARLYEAGYEPYYMYRQKMTNSNLENVAFSLRSKASIYNVISMNDLTSIYAFGAGAVSKYIDKDNLERKFNYKDIDLYIKNVYNKDI
ncbi:MAG: coproporphyrinogen dehydrogenase HemZ [Eubacteriales bacterium]|nr:coproporphyrinogen dehydrogenase HemZ [Eubacteriales bacterium]